MDRIQLIGRHYKNINLCKPVRVVITGAAGQIGYVLSFMVAGGRLLGPNQPIDLVLLEIPASLKACQGVEMEILDAAFPLVNSLLCTTDQVAAFKGCQFALLVGARPRGPGMQRKDLLEANAAIFKNQAQVIQDNADPNVKIAVVGNPANTNAAILAEYATKIPKENITAMTRLDQNRATGQIADRLKTGVNNVKNVMIWGNHSLTQYPDIRSAVVNVNGKQEKVTKYITDWEWVHKTFIPLIQKRGGQIIEMRKASSAASAAAALCDHVHDWIVGTISGETVAMGVMSDGSYGVPKGLNFSFPVTCTNGHWRIVQGYDFNDEFSKNALAKTLKELTDEKETALSFLKAQK